MTRLITALLLMAAAALPAHAGGHAGHGQQLAEANCAQCHAIAATGDSPLPPAPPFRDIAGFYDEMDLIDGFMEGLSTHDPRMPDWQMTMEQAQDLAAYILTLKAPGQAEMANSPAARGRELLAAKCAPCHAIYGRGDSALAQAPPFREVVTRYLPDALQEALAEGIATGHEAMPQFEFSPDDITSIIAYLGTLKRP